MPQTQNQYDEINKQLLHITAPFCVTSSQQKVLHGCLIDTPLGYMIALADNSFLYVLEFMDQSRLELKIKKLCKKLKAAIIVDKTELHALVEKELIAYFKGEIRSFKTPLFYQGSQFAKNVWQELQKIPCGTTQSYKYLACATGNAKGYRAVAQANGANNILIIIPCHRIINHDGKLGGYSSGLDRKKWLINHEKNYAISDTKGL